MNDALLAKHEDLIRQLRPEVQSIQHIGAGDINDAVLVDESEVFRFPKSEEGRQTLRYEAVILGRLSGNITLDIPGVHEVAEDGSYGIFTYVPGRILSSEEIMSLSTGHKQDMALAIANCMREISSTITLDEASELARHYRPWHENEDAYHKTVLTWEPQKQYRHLYAHYYDMYLLRQQAAGKPKEIVAYGDFHYGNLLFNEANELTGLIDFGDFGPDTIMGELRQLYRLGEDIVQAIITELDGYFGEIDMELVKLRAVVHEISVLMRPESQPPHHNHRANLSKMLLAEWLGKDWEEIS